MLLNIKDLDRLNLKEAKKNSLFNPKSKKWVAAVIQDVEIVVIRQNNQHGFISLGWDDPDKKFIIYYEDDYEMRKSKYNRYIRKKMISLANAMANHLNKAEK